MVWTLIGLKPIETLRTGDQILTQATDTGELSFKPVLAVQHGVLQPTKTLTIDKAPIVTTAVERIWVASKGWVMVADLKPGDPIRSVSGLRRVTTVEDAEAAPVYHVRVGDGRGITVGESGILVHDEQMAQPVAAPFDSAEIALVSQSAQ